MALSIFPVRVPIGKAGSPDCRQLDVLMTPEFARALSSLLERVGGPDGVSTTELAKMVKQLQAQAVLFVEQIANLFDLANTLALEAEEQAVSTAMQNDQGGQPNLAARIEDLRLQIETAPQRPDVSQHLADIILMLAIDDRPAPIQKNTVTGSRGGNVALASLLTALSKSGLINDSTTV